MPFPFPAPAHGSPLSVSVKPPTHVRTEFPHRKRRRWLLGRLERRRVPDCDELGVTNVQFTIHPKRRRVGCTFPMG